MNTETLSQEQEQVEKANAWMELILADYELTDSEKVWWNATLDGATSYDMDQIVKLYESALALGACRRSLGPTMMRFVGEYWEGSYGRKQKKEPEQLLLAAYRAR